jgi:hypothetical protein
MIGLVRLLPPSGDELRVEVLDRLPEPIDASHSGYLVRCGDEAEMAETLAWYTEVRVARPSITLGIVCSPAVCAAALGRTTIPIQPVIDPDLLQDGHVPPWGISELRSVSVEAQIVAELVEARGDGVAAERALLEILVSYACRGRTFQRLCRDLKRSDDVVRERLTAIGVQPGRFMSAVRLRAYDLLVERGHRPVDARLACGWTSAKARDQARKRCQ